MMTNTPNMSDGNDLYREIILSNTRIFPVTYWDLWIAILLSTQFAGDWETMLTHFRQQAQMPSWQRDHAEGMINHLRLLRQALEEDGLSTDDILRDAAPDFLKKQKTKVKRKLLEFSFKEQEKSKWMINTPRRQRNSRAMRGYWRKFPVSPLIFAADLTSIFGTGEYYLEKESFKLESKLSSFLNKKEARLEAPDQLALYRAFLTVVVENMDGVDDSYGVVGDLYGKVFETYYQLDRTQINLPREIYFQDLLELLIWEDYALTYQSQPDFFASLSESEALLVEGILRQQQHELLDLELDYQSQKALSMLEMLNAEETRFDRFVPIAKEMGAKTRKRGTTLAGATEKHSLYDLALGVYQACMESYEKLKKRIKKLLKKSKKSLS